ncbi:MAG: hypothetical protein NW241_04890 [Bacteroidia bacterium]|nr:hypothetical protein [Bacteroidia bacterium]
MPHPFQAFRNCCPVLRLQPWIAALLLGLWACSLAAELPARAYAAAVLAEEPADAGAPEAYGEEEPDEFVGVRGVWLWTACANRRPAGADAGLPLRLLPDPPLAPPERAQT